jgi:secretion/DNA translocation related TadE-like protein
MIRLGDDSGAGGVLALALVGAAVTVSVATMSLGSALTVRQRVIAAADAAALAAADGASGAVAVPPCRGAALVAQAAGASLTECRLDGLVATVEVAARVGPVPTGARSTAGPPAGHGEGRLGVSRAAPGSTVYGGPGYREGVTCPTVQPRRSAGW